MIQTIRWVFSPLSCVMMALSLRTISLFLRRCCRLMRSKLSRSRRKRAPAFTSSIPPLTTQFSQNSAGTLSITATQPNMAQNCLRSVLIIQCKDSNFILVQSILNFMYACVSNSQLIQHTILQWKCVVITCRLAGCHNSIPAQRPPPEWVQLLANESRSGDCFGEESFESINPVRKYEIVCEVWTEFLRFNLKETLINPTNKSEFALQTHLELSPLLPISKPIMLSG